MTNEAGAPDERTLSPHEAFGALANETRMEILEALGEADRPLAFSTLRDAVSIRDSGQFNYHLNQLVDHFIRQTDDGYELRQPGRRVVQAILSGAVTGAPEVEASPIDVACIYCGAETEVSFRQERLLWRCTECAGLFEDHEATSEAFGTLPRGTIDLAYLPAAGIQDRTPREMLEASDVWSAAEDVAMTNGVCPRCSGAVEDTLSVCEDHEDGDGVCEQCHSRMGVTVRSECQNCRHSIDATFLIQLIADPSFRAIFDSRGVDIISTALEEKSAFAVEEYEVLNRDPFRARLTHIVSGDEVSVIVNDELAVEEVID